MGQPTFSPDYAAGIAEEGWGGDGRVLLSFVMCYGGRKEGEGGGMVVAVVVVGVFPPSSRDPLRLIIVCRKQREWAGKHTRGCMCRVCRVFASYCVGESVCEG